MRPFVAGGSPSSLAPCGISSRQRLRSLRVAMVFRVLRAVFFLVLVVVPCSRQMLQPVFVGNFFPQREPQRCGIQSLPFQYDRHDHYPLNRLDWFFEQRPMIDGKPLEPGALVGYELDEFTKFVHAGIYVGRGDWRLRNLTGVENLSPFKHYVIEFSGPILKSNLTNFQVGKVINGKGKQYINITEMVPSLSWCTYEMNSKFYGTPLNGTETILRAASEIGSPSGRYDVFRNNCQHFAVWARYDKKLMLLSEEKLQASVRQILGWAAFAVAARAGNVPLAMGVIGFSLANLLTAKTGTMSQKVVGFEYVPASYTHHELQKIMSEWEAQIQEKERLEERLETIQRVLEELKEGKTSLAMTTNVHKLLADMAVALSRTRVQVDCLVQKMRT